MVKKNSARLFPALLLAGLTVGGCEELPHRLAAPPPLPGEQNKVILSDYIIEPPDILLIDALAVVPRPPYKIATQDVLAIQVPSAFPANPIAGLYVVEPDGTVNLGPAYGSVQVNRMTLGEAAAAIEDFLRPRIKDVKATVALAQSRILQQVRGTHIVTPDGKVRLGVYGEVRVVGLTVRQAKNALEEHLRQYLENPEISVDVVAYNSKVYYVVLDGGGNGQQILRLPVTGNDTVLDALGQVGGLTPLSSKRIWIARPAPAGQGCDQILPVDWSSVVARARPETNYQLFPGDRIYVAANPLVTIDTGLARVIAPLERLFGITLLGNATVQTFRINGTGTGTGTGTGF
jgi:protein involved in polysaccharide export with SLBB domain